MLLAIDIGNTLVAFGLYREEEFIANWQVATEATKTADEYAVLLTNLLAQRGLQLAQVRAGIISCVVPPLLATFQQLYQRYLGVEPLVVGPGVRTGVRIRYEDPREVGADRVANALAVRRLYSTPAIVIDFSTAIIFDAISAEGDYLGGAIAPGLELAADALFRFAARLPRVELVPPQGAIGRNNVASIQSGLIYGYVGLVEGMIARFQKELGGGARVIATGPLAEAMATHIPAIHSVDPNLTLKGLKFIYDMNRA